MREPHAITTLPEVARRSQCSQPQDVQTGQPDEVSGAAGRPPEAGPGRAGAPDLRRIFAEIGRVPRRDRFTSAPRSVEFRVEIGSLPRRDRSSSASRSVPSTRSLKNLFSHTSPVMDYGPLSSPRPIATRPQNRMSVRMTLDLLGAVPLDDRPCNDAAPHRCSGSPGGQCHSDGHPPAREPAIETADSGATRMAGRLREPISTRNSTDLEPGPDRSRRGSEPISAKEARSGGAAGQTGHNRHPRNQSPRSRRVCRARRPPPPAVGPHGPQHAPRPTRSPPR